MGQIKAPEIPRPINALGLEEETMRIFANPYYDMMGPVNPREQKFCGPCCDRCQHRFGTTSNRDWCRDHWKNEKCYRFKLER